MDPTTDSSPRPALAAPAEPRQRWRLTYAREPVSVEQVGRASLEAWQATLVASGLPVAGLEAGGAGRARIAFGAPLPASIRGEAELADLFLLERQLVWQVREALEGRLPPGHRWVAAEGIWLGAPPLAGRVTGADWRVELTAPLPDVARLRAAGRALLDARELPRTRVKGGIAKRYDLRPLLVELAVDSDGSIRFRTRIHPELGSGRPDEVVATLTDAAGIALDIAGITRLRLVLVDDLDNPPRRD